MNYDDYLDLVVYEIYPRSFYDSNSDGIGDLNGIKEKIPYLSNLGINAIWICPIFKSPMIDNGYDIEDYQAFNQEFGTIDDFLLLLNIAHKNNIKVFLDLVANHTSANHKWFLEAKKSKDSKYHNYYYFKDEKPNDWSSCFGGSAWEYNEETKEYYLHSFAVQQPDLNWNNRRVRKEFKKIVDYYSELGVDGFRCDVIDYISKDFKNNKINNGPKLHRYLKELFGRKKIIHLFTVGECQANAQSLSKLTGKRRKELKCSFQFDHFDIGRIDKYTPKEHNFSELKNILIFWQDLTIKNDLLYALLTDNHDQPWYNSRIGDDDKNRYESATLIASMVFLLRGIPFIYQGQEIGSANSHFTDINDFNDIETINYYNDHIGEFNKDLLIEKINYGSRDNPRRPFAWNKEKNHGFTSAKSPWIPYSNRSNEINLENDLKEEKSIFKYYQKILSLRKNSNAIKRGNFIDISTGPNNFIFKREYEKEKITVFCNFEKTSNISLDKNIELILSNIKKEDYNEEFLPYEVRIYKNI